MWRSRRLVLAVLAVSVSPRLLLAQAQPAGLEYDQIMYLNTDMSLHPPGSFGSDLEAIETAAVNGELGAVESRQRAATL
jgi:hypothetical protein